MTYRFKYRIEDEEGNLILDVPKFPEIVVAITDEDLSSGQVKFVVEDAIQNALQARLDYNDEIPAPDPLDDSEQWKMVTLPPLAQSKLLLYREFRKESSTRAEFAKRLGVTQTTISRMLDLSHHSRFDVVVNAFEKLGLTIETEVTLRAM